MHIHPTAIIHPDAQLDASVKVGPYAVIEGAVRIAENCTIAPHVVLSGEVVIGPDSSIGSGAIIGGEPQDLAFKSGTRSRVVIGARSRIREHVTIHRGTAEGSETVVGDDCLLMAGAHLGHNARVGNHVILANNVLLGGYAEIADRVFIGGGAVFHQYTKVGTLAICQGQSGFSKFVPPFMVGAGVNMVAGLNIVGLRRAGFTPAQRSEVKRAFDLLYRSGRNTSQALDAAAESSWDVAAPLWEFVRGAKRKGICPLIGEQGASNPSSDAE